MHATRPHPLTGSFHSTPLVSFNIQVLKETFLQTNHKKMDQREKLTNVFRVYRTRHIFSIDNRCSGCQNTCRSRIDVISC
jgi:hypothetical protein